MLDMLLFFLKPYGGVIDLKDLQRLERIQFESFAIITYCIVYFFPVVSFPDKDNSSIT